MRHNDDIMNLSRQSSATVSARVLHEMLHALRGSRGRDVAAQALASAAIPRSLLHRSGARITRQQYGSLYRVIAATLDDEMLGLWSRPIRSGTLKYLMLSLLDAPTVLVALNRFVRFWNLLLDDYRLHISTGNDAVRIALLERTPGLEVKPLGHALMMKLIHGITSWLLGREISLNRAEFRFPRPRHAEDYVFMFPGEVRFDAAATSISLAYQDCAAAFKREKHELWAFLKRAPEDWIFRAVEGGTVTARTREYLEQLLSQPVTIHGLASALHMSVRTLNRRFAEEGTHFQQVKDGLRRDIAVHRLTHSNTPVAALAFDLGFSDATGFCRAFRHWTGSSPTDYRNGARQAE
jgi:AraC-like DNA-binding protein